MNAEFHKGEILQLHDVNPSVIFLQKVNFTKAGGMEIQESIVTVSYLDMANISITDLNIHFIGYKLVVISLVSYRE